MTEPTRKGRRWAGARVLLVAIGLAMWVPAPAAGQQQRAQLERRIRERFAEMVRERLELDVDQSMRVANTLEAFGSERSVLAAEARSLRVRVRNAIREAGGGPVSDAEGAMFLQEMRDLAERESFLVTREQDALVSVLPPGKLVLFYQLREQMNERIQQLRRGANNRRPSG